MSDNIISIADWRKKPDEQTIKPPIWLFDLSASVGLDGHYEGTITSFNVSVPGAGGADAMRRYADCLDQLSWFLRQNAEQEGPSDDGAPIATALVFESSRVRVRINDDKVTTGEQLDWLDDRFDDAKAAARPNLSTN